MSSWSLIHPDNCCSNTPIGECITEKQEKHLALSSTSTHGWRDLDVYTITSWEDDSKKPKPVTQLTGKFKFKKGIYQPVPFLAPETATIR